MSDDPTTQELKLGQLRREAGERAQARTSETPAAGRAHARRAEKASYLKEKLAERERAEREAAAEDDGPA